ncbi:MAG: 2-C-methyl-D-erythritol 2,4-cyclodiphosphate synthase [Nitrospirae bacterium]|nr:2-C-methyl-D-erythritol 2,4-cyclodiphosphate synthase [Nitrospirota bacterium]
MIQVGIGYDSHRFVKGRPFVLGGVKIPYEYGLQGHSDADVLTHAIIDAILGASGFGDIGKLFPDTDPRWKDYSSLAMLKYVLQKIKEQGFEVQWVDSIVILERPKIGGYIEEMKLNYESAGISKEIVSIKGKTNEKMGFVGRGEGVVAMAVVTLRQLKY